MAKEKKKTKGRSEQRRVAPTKKGINKIVQGKIKKGEVVQPGKLAAKAAVKGAKAVKAVKAKGLEKRGTKLSSKEKNIRDKEYIQNKRFDKTERTYDAKISQTSSGEKLKGLGKSGRKKITRENQIFAKLKQKNK